MVTQTFPQIFKLNTTESPREKRNPFIKALKQVEYGQLTLTTPNGNHLLFKGKSEGVNADWRINDWKVFDDFIARGDIGLAESYIAGRWDTSNLAALLTFGLLNADKLEKFFHGHPLYALWLRLKSAFSENSLSGSRRNIVKHYDLGNDFYKLWLDKSMTYSCGLFEKDRKLSLEEAQKAKYARILRRLGVKPGQHILELGCGWGGFAEAAGREGARVTGITISDGQFEYAKKRIKEAGLEPLVEIKLMDYRKVTGTFDYVVSIGMFEHVGEKYWETYFNTIKNHLKPGGRAMIQSIIIDDGIFKKLHNVTGFIEHYIFPGGMLPSKERFKEVAEAAGFTCRDIYFFGQDYAITLERWLENFESKLDEVKALGYDEKFIRMWRFYLCSCIASFKSHRTSVMQIELERASGSNSISPEVGLLSDETSGQKAA
jgi:cyclopropane-fatty-acyl-phospholipid synthase